MNTTETVYYPATSGYMQASVIAFNPKVLENNSESEPATKYMNITSGKVATAL